MPTSAPGSRHARRAAPARGRGFTLIELLIVIAIVAVSAGVISLALRDGDASKLEEEGARLAALLEMARAESRVSGSTLRWVPVTLQSGDTNGANFNFVGAPAAQPMPTRWLAPATSAEVVGGVFVVLGPDAILPPQRIVLRLHAQRLEVASDGLAPFAAAAAGATDAAAR